jgi:hypothetical protein
MFEIACSALRSCWLERRSAGLRDEPLRNAVYIRRNRPAQEEAKAMLNRIRSVGLISGIGLLAFIGILSGMIRANSMKDQNSIEARLRRLEDREEIRRLLSDYGRFLDQRNFAAFSQLFADQEGEWIGGMGRARGQLAIRKLMENSIGTKSDGSNFHLFTNEIIDVDGDRATASTKWIFVVRGDENRPQPVYLGHYQDSLIRANGKWKFLQRVVCSDIPADNPASPK